MKSIKEKANEIGWQHTKHYDPNVCKQEWCEMAARDGANYVLEEIEKLVKTTNGDGETYHYNLYIGLVKLLEQLKK